MDTELVSFARRAVPENHVYADWSARALPLRDPHFADCVDDLASGYLHPHSVLKGEDSTSGPGDAARAALAKLVGDCGSTHDVVLVSGATEALRKVSERLPWAPNDVFVCHTHAHLALLGVRAPAIEKGARFVAMDTQELDDALQNSPLKSSTCASDFGGTEVCEDLTVDGIDALTPRQREPMVVLGYPGECNLTGALYPFERWAKAAHERDWTNQLSKHGGSVEKAAVQRGPCVVTLVDAAALVACKPIPPGSLRNVDLLCCSLYKLTGVPTGVGALFIRRDSACADLLMQTARHSYFAGGRSSTAVSPRDGNLFVPAKTLIDSLELGTANLDGISRAPHVLKLFANGVGGLEQAYTQSSSVAEIFRRALRESFGKDRVDVYEEDFKAVVVGQGPVVAFNLTGEDLEPIGHTEVASVLLMNGVYVRAGCMCNPGACAEVLHYSEDAIRKQVESGSRCDELGDVVDGRRTGVVRASFGWASTEQDALDIATILWQHFGRMRGNIENSTNVVVDDENVRIERLFLYPVKSCTGHKVLELAFEGQQKLDHGIVSRGGAVGDRAYAIIGRGDNRILRRAACPELDLIAAEYVDGSTGKALRLCHRSGCAISFPLGLDEVSSGIESVTESKDDMSSRGALVDMKKTEFGCTPKESRLTREGMFIRSSQFGKQSALWLQLVSDGRLDGELVVSAAHGSLANRGGSVHVVNLASCEALAAEIGPEWDAWMVARSARANVIISGLDCWAEDAWQGRSVKVGGVILEDVRRCGRCKAMNLSDGEPLRTLKRLCVERISQRSITFGVVGVVREPGVMQMPDLLPPDPCR